MIFLKLKQNLGNDLMSIFFRIVNGVTNREDGKLVSYQDVCCSRYSFYAAMNAPENFCEVGRKASLILYERITLKVSG